MMRAEYQQEQKVRENEANCEQLKSELEKILSGRVGKGKQTDLECRQELAETLGLKHVSHEDLSRHHCVDWVKAHEAHFSSVRMMEMADLTGIPLKSIMGPINYRPLKLLGSPGLIVEPRNIERA